MREERHNVGTNEKELGQGLHDTQYGQGGVVVMMMTVLLGTVNLDHKLPMISTPIHYPPQGNIGATNTFRQVQ